MSPVHSVHLLVSVTFHLLSIKPKTTIRIGASAGQNYLHVGLHNLLITDSPESGLALPLSKGPDHFCGQNC